jgi:hypothetical protein
MEASGKGNRDKGNAYSVEYGSDWHVEQGLHFHCAAAHATIVEQQWFWCD